jgi:hypothetical protein
MIASLKMDLAGTQRVSTTQGAKHRDTLRRPSDATSPKGVTHVHDRSVGHVSGNRPTR